LTSHAKPIASIHLRARTRLAPSNAASGRQLSGLVATPHSGYHFDGSNRRFFEGWYWKVTADDGTSFALIYSVEDPAGGSLQGGVGVQIMGPKHGDYLCQFSRDTSCFWADPHQLALGATLRPRTATVPRAMTSHVGQPGFQWSMHMAWGMVHGRSMVLCGPHAKHVKSTTMHGLTIAGGVLSASGARFPGFSHAAAGLHHRQRGRRSRCMPHAGRAAHLP
jgi:hypothetical protein